MSRANCSVAVVPLEPMPLPMMVDWSDNPAGPFAQASRLKTLWPGKLMPGPLVPLMLPTWALVPLNATAVSRSMTEGLWLLNEIGLGSYNREGDRAIV